MGKYDALLEPSAPSKPSKYAALLDNDGLQEDSIQAKSGAGATLMDALFPARAKAEREGAGLGRQMAARATDALTLIPSALYAAAETVNPRDPKSERTFKENLADRRGGSFVKQMTTDPGVVAALATSPFTGGLPLIAQGAISGAASAAGHQAENIAEGEGFKPGQAAGEIALSALLPAATKKGGELLKGKAKQIVQSVLKSGKNIGGRKTLTLDEADTFLQKFGSLRGLGKSQEAMEAAHKQINKEFSDLMKGPAKNKAVDVRAVLEAADRRVDRLAKTFDLKVDEVGAIKATVNKWREFFGANADDLSRAARQAGSTLKSEQATSQAQKAVAVAGEKSAKAAQGAQAAAQKDLSKAGAVIQNLKRHGTDFGWWYDDAKAAAKQAADAARAAAETARAKLAVNQINQSDYTAALKAAESAARRLEALDAASFLQQGAPLDDVAARLAKSGKAPEEIAEIVKAARGIVDQAKEVQGTLAPQGVVKFPQAQKFKTNTLDEAANFAKVPAGMRAPEMSAQANAGRIARRKLSSAMTRIEPELAPLNERFKEVANLEPFVEQGMERAARNRGFSLQDLITMGLLPGAGAGAATALDRPELAALGAIPFLISRGQKSPAAATAMYRLGSTMSDPGRAGQLRKLAIENLLRTQFRTDPE